MGGKVEDRDDLTLTLASDKITIGAGTDAGTAGNFWSNDPYSDFFEKVKFLKTEGHFMCCLF